MEFRTTVTFRSDVPSRAGLARLGPVGSLVLRALAWFLVHRTDAAAAQEAKAPVELP
jgi:hypothetical protein